MKRGLVQNSLYSNQYYRYLKKPSGAKKMTLIIGFKCIHGVALVSDTKLTTISQTNNKSSKYDDENYDSKILQPMSNNAFIVGAAGYTDLFQEFNNKIPELVEQRIKEYDNLNIKAITDLGYTVDEAIDKYIAQGDRQLAPFQYSYENLMDDCKTLIKNISNQRRQQSINPLDMLIAVKKGNKAPSLHYVDSFGLEEEKPFWFSIGTGTPYVKQYFGRLYDFNMDMRDLVALALFCITYTKDIAREETVGYSSRHPPEAWAIFNNANCEKLKIEDMAELLKGIEKEVRKIEKTICASKIEDRVKADNVFPADLIIRSPNRQDSK